MHRITFAYYVLIVILQLVVTACVLMENQYKYPRTFHLWFSLGTSSEDRLWTKEETLSVFEGKEVVVTEKIDGENSSLYRHRMHVRSLDSRTHPSQNWLRQLHASIAHDIPEGWRLCGENVYAQHSIRYDQLTTFFYVFAIYNDKNVCLSWDDTKSYCELLGLQTVPELYRGVWDEDKVRACWTGKSKFGPDQEGYVVRIAEEFPYPVSEKGSMPLFKTVGKFVREKHVQTDDHWRMTWIPNKLMV